MGPWLRQCEAGKPVRGFSSCSCPVEKPFSPAELPVSAAGAGSPQGWLHGLGEGL